MSKPLRALVVEDSENDTILLVRYFKQQGYDLTYERVDSPAAMCSAVTNSSWDIVISDYVMPQFSGIEVLKLLKQAKPNLPCIILSGKIGEDTAVSAMKASATRAG